MLRPGTDLCNSFLKKLFIPRKSKEMQQIAKKKTNTALKHGQEIHRQYLKGHYFHRSRTNNPKIYMEP